MEKTSRNLIRVKVILRAAAFVEVGYFTASHWFFHQRFFNWLGIDGPDLNSPFVVSQLRLIGALVLGFAALGWIAASDPRRHRAVIQVLLLTGSACVMIFVSSVITGALPPQFLLNAMLLALPILLVTVLYPWKGDER